MRHLDDPLQRIHMFQLVARLLACVMPAKIWRLRQDTASTAARSCRPSDLVGIMVADLLLADKLQLGIQPHHPLRRRYAPVAADAVTNHSEFHRNPP